MTMAQNVTPDRTPLTRVQAARLAGLSGLDARELVGQTALQISDKFRWRIDPELLLFRRICGRVVKKDPVTGVLRPVPFATVHVEDTDCNLLWYSPPAWPWGWMYPWNCHREELGSVVTDECGRFCVWIPRWDIDWILRYRHIHFCLPDIFTRPRLRDLLDDLRQQVPPVHPRRPDPDPSPWLLRDGGLTLRRAEELLGRPTANRLLALQASATVGASAAAHEELLDAPAFPEGLPAPLPASLKLPEMVAQGPDRLKARLSSLAAHAELDREVAERIDLGAFHGPFRRCYDYYIPEWQSFIDVPDITFRVTQDVNGDGTQDTIYSESYFDVRWDAGAIPDVTLYASQSAITSVTCDVPTVSCENTPAINYAGLMPLVNPPSPAAPYHDAGPGEPATIAPGYARRPNRPHPNGLLSDPLPNPLAKAPYTGTLLLYGCNHQAGAAYYRLRFSVAGGSFIPFTGLTWPLYRMVGTTLQTHWPTADANGWYPVLADSDGWTPEHLLLAWPTDQFQNGLYTVELQVANASKAVIGTAAHVRFRIDNSAPVAHFTSLAWRVAGTGAWTDLELICPVVIRPVVGGAPASIEFKVGYQVIANHLQSLRLSGGGCGGGAPAELTGPTWSDPPGPVNPYQHWSTDPDLDNSEAHSAVFSLAGSALPGAYSFTLFAASRAFNPGDPTGFTVDWNYDPTPNYVTPSLPIAVVNP